MPREMKDSGVLFLPEWYFHRKAKMSIKQYTKSPLSLDEKAQLLLDCELKGISKEALV